MTNSGYDTVGGAFHCTLVDLATGKCLERENGRDVTVKFSDWDLTKRKTYKGSDGSWIKRYGMAKVHVSVVYPADYKGLCIAAGGCTQREFQNPSFNRAFYSGNKKFGKTSYVSILNRKVTHVMRVK